MPSTYCRDCRVYLEKDKDKVCDYCGKTLLISYSEHEVQAKDKEIQELKLELKCQEEANIKIQKMKYEKIEKLQKENEELKEQIKFLDEECKQKFNIEIKKLKDDLKLEKNVSEFNRKEVENLKIQLNASRLNRDELQEQIKKLEELLSKFQNGTFIDISEYKKIKNESMAVMELLHLEINKLQKENQELKKNLICFRRGRCDEHKLYLYRDGSVYMCKLGCKYEESEMELK